MGHEFCLGPIQRSLVNMLSLDAGMTHDAVVIELFIVNLLHVKQNKQLWVAKVLLQFLNSFILPLSFNTLLAR